MTILLGSQIILHHRHNPTDLNLRIKECEWIDFATLLEKSAKDFDRGKKNVTMLGSQIKKNGTKHRKERIIYLLGGK